MLDYLEFANKLVLDGCPWKKISLYNKKRIEFLGENDNFEPFKSKFTPLDTHLNLEILKI